VAVRRERASLFCTRVALDAPACGRSTSSLGAMAAMTPRIQATVAAMVLLFFARTVLAPIHGLFPGLSNLIAESECIVVALIVTGPELPRDTTFNDWQPQRVRVLYVLKGTLRPQSEETVRLGTLVVLGGGDFDVGERYLLFLTSDGSSIHLVNVDGSAFRVPATIDLGKLHPNDVRTNIGLLLKDLVSHTKGPNTALEKAAADYLQSP
jgi:hypothetical protein